VGAVAQAQFDCRKRLRSQSRERIVVVSAPIALALERKRGGASGGDSHRRRLARTPTSRNSAGFFPGSRAVRACPGRFGHLMAAKKKKKKIGRAWGTGRVSRPAVTEAAIVMVSPRNSDSDSPSDNPSLSGGFANLCQQATQCLVMELNVHATKYSQCLLCLTAERLLDSLRGFVPLAPYLGLSTLSISGFYR